MNSKLVLASFVAALSGFAGLATPAMAGSDLNLHLSLPRPPFGLPRPPSITISEHDRRDNGDRRDDRRDNWDRREDRHENWGRRDDRSYSNHGYWREVVVKTWVPGRSFVTQDRRGCEVRVCEPGRYEYRTDRVWVTAGNDDRRYSRG